MPVRLTLADAREAADKRGGECLSTIYINCQTKMEWRCSEGHEWKSKFNDIRNGHWCPDCAGLRRLTLADAQKSARKRGGECLSTEYKNNRTIMRWKCSQGHEWDSASHSIKMGNAWCRKCAGLALLTIEEMQEIARNRGECLSDIYVGSGERLRWMCSEGHEWEATATAVKNNHTWCQKCAGNLRLTIDDMRNVAKKRDGECLSRAYTNQKSRLLWRCCLGHEWEAAAGAVTGSFNRTGTWCPECHGTPKLTIEEMHEVARMRGGECLSQDYQGGQIPLRWRCSERHQWDARPAHIRINRSWCPHCLYKNEQECRRTIERLTGKKFPKQRPRWLDGLELDGYNQEIEIAFEYQGEQHSRVVEPWHRNGEADLDAQQERDAMKVAACEDHGTDLIVIDFDVDDKLGFITRALTSIYRKRRAVLMAARMAKEAISPAFTIADDDSVWAESGL